MLSQGCLDSLSCYSFIVVSSALVVAYGFTLAQSDVIHTANPDQPWRRLVQFLDRGRKSTKLKPVDHDSGQGSLNVTTEFIISTERKHPTFILMHANLLQLLTHLV